MAIDIVGSKMPQFASEALKPSKAGYGQNNFGGASSDLPGENTTSGFLPQCVVPPSNRKNIQGTDIAPSDQLRAVSKESYPIHPGMASPKDQGKIPDHISYSQK